MRLEPLQEDVGRDLEQDIWHEEYGEGDVCLVASKVEVFGETQGESIGDVHP